MDAAQQEQEALAYVKTQQLEEKTHRVQLQLEEKQAAKRREIEAARVAATKRIDKAVSMGKQILVEKRERYDTKQEAAARRHAEREKEKNEETVRVVEGRQKKLMMRDERLANAHKARADKKAEIVSR